MKRLFGYLFMLIALIGVTYGSWSRGMVNKKVSTVTSPIEITQIDHVIHIPGGKPDQEDIHIRLLAPGIGEVEVHGHEGRRIYDLINSEIKKSGLTVTFTETKGQDRRGRDVKHAEFDKLNFP